jgi:hypothetical protein
MKPVFLVSLMVLLPLLVSAESTGPRKDANWFHGDNHRKRFEEPSLGGWPRWRIVRFDYIVLNRWSIKVQAANLTDVVAREISVRCRRFQNESSMQAG